jgi:uncharacterized RDD family membrane protein YckC
MGIEGLPPAPPPDDLWAPAPDASSQELADWWPRAGAATIDFFVRLGIVAACSAVGALAYLAGETAGDVGLGVGIAIGYVLALFVYGPLMLARTDGQTVGHRVTDTRIVMADGSRMSGGRAFVREALVKNILIEGVGLVTFYILPIVNYLFPLWDKGNEALHDKICGTHVVAARPVATLAA